MSLPRYPEYKESGVEWLGRVPTHWEVKRLKHNLRLLTEKTDRRTNPIALENIESWSGRFVPTETEFQGDGVAFERDDILFGKLRPYLAKVLLAPECGEAVGDFHVMRPSSAIYPRFAQFSMLNRNFVNIVDGSTFGSKMPRASWDFVSSIEMATPTLAEQIAIATFLDRETGKIDALIAEQEKLLALLAEKRQATISHAVTKGLNSDVPMKDSGVVWLGEVPEHWVVTPIKALFRQQKRQNFPDKEVLSVYRDYGVVRKGSRTDNLNKTPDDLSSYQLVEQNDLVVNKMKGWQGSLGVSEFEGITSPDYMVFSPLHTEDSTFLHILLRSPPLVSTYRSISNGIRPAQWRLEPEQFLRTKIYLPPIEEQETIVSYCLHEIAKLDGLKAESERAITLLKERRSALISAAVTGQIDVRQA